MRGMLFFNMKMGRKICMIFFVIMLYMVPVLLINLISGIGSIYFHRSWRDYVPGTSNIKGNVNTVYFTDKSSDLEIGANLYGYAVFKYPDRAYEYLYANYSYIMEYLSNKCDIGVLNAKNIDAYYGCMADMTRNEEVLFVDYFLGNLLKWLSKFRDYSDLNIT